MSYTPTEWQTGDTITAEKLNKMEGGISANDTALTPFIITLTPTSPDFSGTMDKTPAEILSAYRAGRKIVFSLGLSLYECGETNDGGTYVSVGGTFAIYDNNISHAWYLIHAWTDEGYSTYHTDVFPLTPMS